MSHLSQNAQMILKQTVGKRAKAGHALEKNLQGRQMVLFSTSKRNHHGVVYQLHDQGENDRIQKENRRTRTYLAFFPLSLTFRSGGYINASLPMENEDVVMPFYTPTIHVITEDEDIVETARLIVYPCPPDFELSNWSIVEIPVAYKLTK